MALQTSIAQYFNSRKRRAADEINKVSDTNKVLILDKNITDVSDVSEATSFDREKVNSSKKIILNDSPKVVKPVKIVKSAPKLQKKTPKATSTQKKPSDKNKQADIRKSLLSSFNATLAHAVPEESVNKSGPDAPKELEVKVNVPFQIKGSISPKKAFRGVSSPKRGIESCNTEGFGSKSSCMTPEKSIPDLCFTPKKLRSHTCSTTEKDSSVCNENILLEKTPVKKDIDSIEDLKSKLLRSKRLGDIRNALKKLNEGHEKLKEIESKQPPKSPSLKKFKTVEIEIVSPSKTLKTADSVRRQPEPPSLLKRSLLMSPSKCGPSPPVYVSPRKLFTESSPVKASAFERLAALAAKPSLVLPFKYRSLAETFRAVDTVVSILANRNETIYFSKLKASVQKMSKKNLTETHLGQIHTVCPNLFSFRQEKLRHVPGQSDRYELVVAPVLDSTIGLIEEANKQNDNSCHMTPSILLERKRNVYKALLEKTRDYHQDFLQTLDPPVILDKNQLTRWHPEFDVDGVPDIAPHPLPQPPNVEKYSSAKDVLTKARDMFICNPRMEKALIKVSNETSKLNNTSAAASIPALTSALKGIPNSLLEKVRAKQAAKAAEQLTRNPQSIKRKAEYSRLPELARIVRNIFVIEKKNIIPKTHLLTKLNDSFLEVLTPSDFEHHLNLLMVCTSDWLTTIDSQKGTYYKISKSTDLSKVLVNIENATNKM